MKRLLIHEQHISSGCVNAIPRSSQYVGGEQLVRPLRIPFDLSRSNSGESLRDAVEFTPKNRSAEVRDIRIRWISHRENVRQLVADATKCDLYGDR